MKDTFDKREKENYFKVDDLVLAWDARREEKGKHGKFYILWFGPFIIAEVLDNNTFDLKILDDENCMVVL